MDSLVPIAFAVATWWLATVVVLHRSLRARPRCRPTLAVTTVVGLAGLAAVWLTRDATSVAAAYGAFLGGLAVWGWHEMSYFLGFVTGPRPAACPPDATGARRFGFGVRASLWHELAIIATGLALVAMTWGAANQVGAWTFLIVWWMRWSAKLNIFLGVRNLHVEFWPEHLRYLASYVRTASMNSLFPWSVLAATFAVAALVTRAQGGEVASFERTGLMLLASLLVLGALEHVFLLARVPDALLWRVATGERRTTPFSPELRSGQNP